MKVLGKYISNWWLLGVPLLLVILSPALMMLFFFGNDLAGAIVGPPAIWSRPWNQPAREDVIGDYIETKHRSLSRVEIPLASLSLRADGSMKVENLPYEFADQSCDVSGIGKWRGPDDGNLIDLDVTSDKHAGSCKSTSLSFLQLTGRTKPYGLYWVIGDPDSGTGVWLKRRTP